MLQGPIYQKVIKQIKPEYEMDTLTQRFSFLKIP